ncbi:MAG: transposase, partial [Elusimicrobiota bacterium]
RVDRSVIIDVTALPNQIRLTFDAWGYNDGSIEKQIRFLFVVDKKNSLPLVFRYLPGNVVDVSSLNVTIEELKRLGIKHSFVIIDAGFFSEDNIKELYKEKIDFLTRLPSGRRLYKELIKKEAHQIERFENATGYGKRALFVKKRGINLFGREAYAYIVLDPERKGRETKRFLLSAMEEEEGNREEIEYGLMNHGIMILVSSFEIEDKAIVPSYYLRHMAETLFGFSKDDLKLLPLRVHKEETLRGYLLIIFIALIIFVRLKREIGNEYTVEEILLIMRNLKCKVYENELVIQELTKQQKEIAEILKIIVSKVMGI